MEFNQLGSIRVDGVGRPKFNFHTGPRMLARRSECGECGLCACQACVRARTALWRMKWPSARNRHATTSMPMAMAMNVTT